MVVIFIGIIIDVYLVKFSLKKFVEMMLIRLDMISGRLVVLVINLVVMMNVSVVFLLNFNVSSMVMIIGVRISVVLLLVNSVVIVVLSRMIYVKSKWL